MAALTKILMEQEKKKVVVLFRTCADLRLVERLCQAMNIYTFAVHEEQGGVGCNTLVMIDKGD